MIYPGMLGIDPGVDGAIAVFDADGNLVDMHDMPAMVVSTSGKSKREVDPEGLAKILVPLTHYDGAGHGVATVEHVHAFPKQGVTSSFNFGKAYGIVLGALAACDVKVHLVSPNKWKPGLDIPTGKDGSLQRATELMPDAAYWWPLKKHDGRAEAALIGYYGYKHYK